MLRTSKGDFLERSQGGFVGFLCSRTSEENRYRFMRWLNPCAIPALTRSFSLDDFVLGKGDRPRHRVEYDALVLLRGREAMAL